MRKLFSGVELFSVAEIFGGPEIFFVPELISNFPVGIFSDFPPRGFLFLRRPSVRAQCSEVEERERERRSSRESQQEMRRMRG
jgi:hypothetical protein